MSELSRRTRVAMFLRSFAVQGSWNYRTLIGTGFAFALLPALREIFRGREEELDRAVERHNGLFNCHPYLAPIALGAVAAMEREGEAAPIVERFKTAIRGSLGTLGDRLIWATWRPLCLLFALALAAAGAAWWGVVAAFLVAYNAGHLWLRWWGLGAGLRDGRKVGERLRHSAITSGQRAGAVAGAFLVGLALPLFATGGLFHERLEWPWVALAAGGALLGLYRGVMLRTPAVLALIAVTIVGCLSKVLA